MIARGPLLISAALAVLCLAPLSASADDEVARCTVRIIHALEAPAPAAPAAPPSPGGAPAEGTKPPAQKIDPKIVRLRPYLSRPPFTSWQEFVLLDEKTLDLVPKSPQTFVLPNGKPASLTYLEHVRLAGAKHRVRLQLQIGEADKQLLNTIFMVDEGGVVLQAGQHYKKGMLVLGTSCEEAHAR